MERWKEYPNNISYEISSLGNVRYKKLIGKNETMIDIQIRHCGRFRIVNIGSEVINLHTLVAKVFIPNPDNKSYVKHINGNTHDNCVSNLEWAKRKGGRPKKTDGNGNTLPSVTTDWQEKLDSIPFPDEQESVYNPVVKRINKYVIMNVPFTSQYMVLFIENKLSEHIGTYESYEEANESIQ
jgi:hypothetical protein